MSILVTQYSESVLVLFLDHSTHKVRMHLLRFIAEFEKCFVYWRKILSSFFNYCTRYLYSGCL